MGIPAPMVAGAIISGSYFGDKMSPLSDTTNLAAGLTNTDLFAHSSYVIYYSSRFNYYSYRLRSLRKSFGANNIDAKSIDQTLQVLQQNFVISPFLLIIPVVVMVLVAKSPCYTSDSRRYYFRFLSQVFIQGGSVSASVGALQAGFVIDTGNKLVDELFNRGGLDSMMNTVSMTIVAMTFGGVLEHTGILRSIVNQILKLAKSAKGLIASTIASCFATNLTCSEQYISIVVLQECTQMPTRKRTTFKNLSRALEDGGTLTSVFVPWNTCGVFILATLGVGAFEYAPYAILNFIVPIISIIYGITGFNCKTIRH